MTVWLNVPYDEKNTAKEIGCRWDPEFKQWWKPECIDMSSIPKHWHLREGQRWKTNNNKRGDVVVPKRVR